MNYNQLYQKNKNTWGENSNPQLQLVWKNFTPNSFFLDLGCGQGRDSLFMAKNGFGVTAVDSSKIAIEQIQKIIKKNNLKNIKAIHRNIADFVIEQNKYAIINCNNSLQFLPKKQALGIIKDVQKKLKKNGYILLAAFTTQDPSAKLSKEKRLPTYFNTQEILKLFNGFKIIYYLENLTLDKGHPGIPSPHQHGVVKIVAQKN